MTKCQHCNNEITMGLYDRVWRHALPNELYPIHCPDLQSLASPAEPESKFVKLPTDAVQEALSFIRQVVSGRCDILDLQEIRDAIDRCLGDRYDQI